VAPASVDVEPFQLPVHVIRPQEPVPAGMSVLVMCAVAATLRNTHDQVEPVQVRRDDVGEWHLVEGRHRWLAHWIAGRPLIWCVER
jgi:hypothetical protein